MKKWFPLVLMLSSSLAAAASNDSAPQFPVQLQNTAGTYVNPATSDLQTAGNASLSSIDLGIPASLGQTTMSASMPVVIATDQATFPVNTKNALTPQAPGAFTAGVTSATLVAADAARKSIVIQNLSGNTVSLGMGGNAAVLNSGITLLPQGQFQMDEYTFNTGAITAIASAATSIMSYQVFH